MKTGNKNAYIHKKTTGNYPISEKDYRAAVEQAGCIVCFNLGVDSGPAIFHHCKFNRGYGQKKDHLVGFGLCYNHHDCKASGVAFHRLGRRAWEPMFGYERELYIQNNERLGFPIKEGI